jgi:hypothetical protein
MPHPIVNIFKIMFEVVLEKPMVVEIGETCSIFEKKSNYKRVVGK